MQASAVELGAVKVHTGVPLGITLEGRPTMITLLA